VDLEEDQSPWKDRVSRHRQRWCGTMDSSAEQGLVASCVARFGRARPAGITSVALAGGPRGACGFGCGHPEPSPSGGGGGLNGRFKGMMYSLRIGSISKPSSVLRRWRRRRGFARAWSSVSAGHREACSMTWGSVSADRSIIASGFRPALPPNSRPNRGRSPSPFGGRKTAPYADGKAVPSGTGSSVSSG